MSSATEINGSVLNEYEAAQVREIAAWKSEPPHPISELFRKTSLPVTRAIERMIPDAVMRAAVEKAIDLAKKEAGFDDVKRLAGVDEITRMQEKSLEECDGIARQLVTLSRRVSMVDGAVTGSGGGLTTLVDVPLLFLLSLRTILKVGHCYGYPLNQPRDTQFILGVLLTSSSGSLETRRVRLDQLKEVEDWLVEETQEDLLAEELASLLFQLEVFDQVPFIGAVSGALLNLAFIRRVDITARHVFQERWLRDHGKVDVIEPAETHERNLAGGWRGVLSRAGYSGCYYVGFGATFPVYMLAEMIGTRDNVLTQGLRDGARAATARVDRFLGQSRLRLGTDDGATGPALGLTPA